MKAAFVLAAAGLAIAQSPLLAQVPECPRNCLMKTLPDVSCDVKDVKCVCEKQLDIQTDVGFLTCIGSCDPSDTQKAAKLSAEACKNPQAGQGGQPPAGGTDTTSSAAGSSTEQSSQSMTPSTSMTSASTSSSPMTTTSGMTTSTSGTMANHTSNHNSGSGTGTGSKPTGSTVPGTNAATLPVAGAFVALAAAVFAL